MKVNKLFEKIKYNWIAKVLSFALALALYLVHLATTLEKKTFTVPLQTKATALLQNKNAIPDSVRVTVRSDVKQLSEMNESDFRARLDLSSFVQEGLYSVPVSLDFSSRVLNMDAFEVTVRPQSVSMKLEDRVVLPVEVQASIAGEAAHGFEVSNIIVEPRFADVTGPRSVVENMKSIATDSIDVTRLSSGKKFDVALNNINELASVDTKQKFHVTLEVSPKMITKEFSETHVALKSLSKKLEVIHEPVISVKLTGELLTLESYEISEGSFFVDCDDIKTAGTYELLVETKLPENIQVETDDELKILLSVTDKKNEKAE